MSDDAKKLLIALKVLRDVLDELIKVVDALTRIKQKYGVGLGDLSTINLSNANAMQELTKTLSPEKLGYLLLSVSNILGVDADLKNFGTYDENKLAEFRVKLVDLVKNLDKVVE